MNGKERSSGNTESLRTLYDVSVTVDPTRFQERVKAFYRVDTLGIKDTKNVVHDKFGNRQVVEPPTEPYDITVSNRPVTFGHQYAVRGSVQIVEQNVSPVATSCTLDETLAFLEVDPNRFNNRIVIAGGSTVHGVHPAVATLDGITSILPASAKFIQDSELPVEVLTKLKTE